MSSHESFEGPPQLFTSGFRMFWVAVPLLLFIALVGGAGAGIFFAGREWGIEPYVQMVIFGAFVAIVALAVIRLRPALAGNRGLRRRLARRLQQKGQLPENFEADHWHFVGLSSPSSRTLYKLDTDEDVGFLRIREEGIDYVGERQKFHIDPEDLIRGELLKFSAYSAFGVEWVELCFRLGYEEQRFGVDSRETATLGQGRRRNQEIAQELSRCLPSPDSARANHSAAPAPSASLQDRPGGKEQETSESLEAE